MTSQAHVEFELNASPPHWLEIAKDLHEQADVLYRSKIGMTTYTNHRGAVTTRTRANRGVFLLAGFAIENLLKAYLVFENPDYVANGILAKEIRTHCLTRLREKSRYTPYKNRYGSVLRSFEEGLESWARYPCGLTHQSSVFENEVTPALWKNYKAMFGTHRVRLEKLLTEPWRSPSGGEYHMRYE